MHFRHSGFVILASVLATAAHADSPGPNVSADQPLNLLAPFSALMERSTTMKKIAAFAAGREVVFDSEQTDRTMRTTKAKVLIDGIPVNGAMVSLHRSNLGAETFTENFPRFATPSLTPKISESEALKIAALSSTNPLAKRPELRLVPNRGRTAMDLAWWIDFRSTDVANPGLEVVIDANSGRVMNEISKMHTAETVVYNAHQEGLILKLKANPSAEMKRKVFKQRLGFVPFRVGPLRVRPGARDPFVGCTITDSISGKVLELSMEECEATVLGKNKAGSEACQIIDGRDGSAFMVRPENCDLYATDGQVTGKPSRSADTAMDNARAVFDYYSDRFGRRSFDGKNSVLRSVVQVGQGWNNAAWMGDLNFMVYGMGDGKNMGDFTQLLDVAGHEMTHGVVNTTARLSMVDEPGALNEATADYFGLQISRFNDWQIGVGLFIDKPKDALRSIWKPEMYSDTYVNSAGEKITKPNPSKYSDRYPVTADTQCTDRNDRCFVHMNSTIMSHGYYLIHQRLGKRKTQDLIFRALTQYYRSDTNFHEAANYLRESCRSLFDGATCDLVNEALRKVEL